MTHRFAGAVVGLVMTACQRNVPPRDDSVRTLVETYGAADVQVVIEHKGKIVLERGHDPDVPRPVGAISEQFWTAIALELVDQGALKLDEPIVGFIDEPYRSAPELQRVTLRHLLSHTSGLGKPPRPLGSMWRDAPDDFVLVGLAIEKSTQRPLAEVATKGVIERALLEHTQPCALGSAEPVIAAGICSTARDLVRWQRALEGGTVISASAYREMTTAGTLADGAPLHVGLGVAIVRIGGHAAVVRSGRCASCGVAGGDTSGSLSASVGGDRLHVAVVGDTDPAFAWALVAKQLELARPLAKPVADLGRFAMTFTPPGRAPYGITVRDRMLVVTAPGRTPVELVHIGDYVFESADRSTRVRFEVDGVAIIRVIYASGDDVTEGTPTPRT